MKSMLWGTIGRPGSPDVLGVFFASRNRLTYACLAEAHPSRNSRDPTDRCHRLDPGHCGRPGATSGYAVAGVKLRTGLLIDGMSVIYMKTDGNVLDRNDDYASAWVGNDFGGSPSTLAGDGTPVVGFAARVSAGNKECSGMGLILKAA